MIFLRRFIGKWRHPFRAGDRVQLKAHPGRIAAVVETWRRYDGNECTGVIWENGRKGLVIHYRTDALEKLRDG